jgi:hypothetical protein
MISSSSHGFLRAYARPAEARRYLAAELRAGTLGLMIGAGASISVGLPAWRRLVIRCCLSTGIDFSELRRNRSPSADQLQAVIGRVERKLGGNTAEYRELVRRCLYRRVSLNLNVLGIPLLSALGALLSGSARGSISSVISFNFDNVLEWYLTLHGFKVNIISDLPSLIGAEDVQIYQMQGYLPHPDTSGIPADQLIFSAKSVNIKAGDRLNSWQEVFRQIFLSKVVICVGMSEASANDRVIGPVLADLEPVLRSKHRPTLFWIFGHPLLPDDREMLFDNNVVPIELPTYKAIPPFLLNVCQVASGGNPLEF